MLIGLFLNNAKAQAKEIAFGIVDFLTEKGIKVVTDDESAPILQIPSLTQIDPKDIDFRISLGGDGTILRLMHRFPEITAPLIGINLGSLGFLADVPLDDIYHSLNHLIEGRFKVEERVMLAGVSPDNQEAFAINDVVFHRASNPSLVELSVDVDGLYLNTFSADGLIIATPTGSTAYSLAAGGPIVSPLLRAMVLTPINPHTISNRPLVLWPTKEIRVQYLSSLDPIEVNFDGVAHFSMKTGDSFLIKPATKTFPLISFTHQDYFSTLRTKLNWTGKLRNN
jgi:Predicted sugar kinase